jgi:hypothetical protein
MKTLLITIAALFTASPAQAVDYKPGSLQETVNLRRMEEIMNPFGYYSYQLTGGKKLEEATLTKRKAQVYLWYVCKDQAELRTRINLVDSRSSPLLRDAADALNSMRCEMDQEKLEFTNMRDLIELDRKLRIASQSIREFNKLSLETGDPVSVNQSRALKLAPRSQVGEESNTYLDAR